MQKEEIQQELVSFNAVKDGLALTISETSVRLFEDYKRSDEFKTHQMSGKVLSIDHIRSLAKTRTISDWIVSQICLAQEGKIPPKNVFTGKEDLVRKGLFLASDKALMGHLDRGYAQVCIHGPDDEMANTLFEAVENIKSMITSIRGERGGSDIEE